MGHGIGSWRLGWPDPNLSNARGPLNLNIYFLGSDWAGLTQWRRWDWTSLNSRDLLLLHFFLLISFISNIFTLVRYQFCKPDWKGMFVLCFERVWRLSFDALKFHILHVKDIVLALASSACWVLWSTFYPSHDGIKPRKLQETSSWKIKNLRDFKLWH